MKINNLILPFILLTFVGYVNPDSSTTSSDSFSSSLVQTNYVLGKRIYDADYYINGYHFDIFVLDEFPHFTFKKSTGSIGFDVLGNDDLKTMRSIYVADVNSDGHQDLCYHYAYLSGSSSTRYRIKIYDYYNEEFFYESGNSSFILDLDENKVLVTEEVDGWGSTGLSKLLQANRFYKGTGNTIEFESFTFDYKIKSIYIGGVSTGSVFVAEKDEKIALTLQLRGIGDNQEEPLFSSEEVKIKESEFYTCQTREGTRSYHFIVDFYFIKLGTVDVEISLEKIISPTQTFSIVESGD